MAALISVVGSLNLANAIPTFCSTFGSRRFWAFCFEVPACMMIMIKYTCVCVHIHFSFHFILKKLIGVNVKRSLFLCLSQTTTTDSLSLSHTMPHTYINTAYLIGVLLLAPSLLASSALLRLFSFLSQTPQAMCLYLEEFPILNTHIHTHANINLNF
jgi:hypothetical protein